MSPASVRGTWFALLFFGFVGLMICGAFGQLVGAVFVGLLTRHYGGVQHDRMRRFQLAHGVKARGLPRSF